MSENKNKKGNALIACGIVMMLFSAPNFFFANQRMEEAKEIAKTNEARAKVAEDSAGFKRTIGFVLLAGGAVSLVIGLVKKKKD